MEHKKQSVSARKRLFYFILLAIYLLVSVIIPMTTGFSGVVVLAGTPIPGTMLAGILSSLANISLIFLVVFYDKPGFITAIVLLTAQISILITSFFVMHNPSSLPGFFGNVFATVAAVIIYRRNKRIRRYREAEVEDLKGQQKIARRLFEQTAMALVSAVDSKDTYSHGHSRRVAEYSLKIAEMAGKDEDECTKIYYAALLHDVGKIGIPNEIINKKGRLTPAEYDIIKEHTVKGYSILSSISEYSYLSMGAHFHHERYDGRGYPSGLKGEDIPEIARIIAVADAYDAMTSNRSYREAMPQQLVREEVIKCAGTQFDPVFANIMQQLIDNDVEYLMRERATVNELAGRDELNCIEFKSEISDGIEVSQRITKIHLKSLPVGISKLKESGAAIVLFDSLDERVHFDEQTISDMCYFEYCDIWLDGSTVRKGAREIRTEFTEYDQETKKPVDPKNGISYDIEAVRVKDHVKLKIDDGSRLITMTIALPDSTRFAYIGLTGENCIISDVSIEKSDDPVPEDYIERIAEEISYINVPEGDIPNVQINGHRTDTTIGTPIDGDLKISYHTMSLPTARLVWHCSYIVIYSSDDGKIDGPNYTEYVLIRHDGEIWESSGMAENELTVTKKKEFSGWDDWKEKCKQGYDSEVLVSRKDKEVTVTTDNLGIYITNRTKILDDPKQVYVAFSGDQAAITGIRINRV